MQTSKELLTDLIDRGYSQHEISKMAKDAGEAVTQATISRILSGKHKMPFSRYHNVFLTVHANACALHVD